MTYSVNFSPNAESDLAAIAEYIARDSPSRARSFVAELRDRLDRKLSTFPSSGVSVGTLRYTVFGNYVAIYRVNDANNAATILMVTEGHRNWHRLLDGLA